MKKYLLALLFSFFTTYSFAAAPKLVNYFQGKEGCFILYDLNHEKMLTRYNPARCVTRISADSTFKIALSLMAFDQKLITENTVFKWDGKDKGLPTWNQNQTPHSWLANSAIWVSQALTPQLGMSKIENYLQQFHYGNQDFSGDPGEDNGLTHAWLSSSLKISADEQFKFLKALLTNHLPVSQTAMTDTIANMYLETTPHGWQLYGKTGSGDTQQKRGQFLNTQHQPQDGWFVGFVKKPMQTYLFVLNFSDLKPPHDTEAGGTRARKMTEEILQQMGLI